MNKSKRLQELGDYRIPFSKTWGIFLISVLGLFLEMLLIRWIGTEIRIFAYLQNTILVVCFLGMGLGCFTSREPIDITGMLLFPLFALLLLLAVPITRKALGNISFMLSSLEDFIIWNKGISTDPWRTIIFMFLGLSLTYILMLLVLKTFVPIGRILGRLMLMVLILIYCRRYINLTGIVRGWNRHWHFFFLGAAFLLLEVQNISKASVVLGNTWEVNAVIVSGVLVMILFANLISYNFPKLSLNLVYAVLIGICLALYSIDLASFAFLPYAIKAVLIGALTTLPMLFSGIIFIRSFAVVTGKDEALGANLIGALVSALLQSVTFITGIKALLIIVAILYLASLVTRPKSSPIISQQTSSGRLKYFRLDF